MMSSPDTNVFLAMTSMSSVSASPSSELNRMFVVMIWDREHVCHPLATCLTSTPALPHSTVRTPTSRIAAFSSSDLGMIVGSHDSSIFTGGANTTLRRLRARLRFRGAGSGSSCPLLMWEAREG